MANFNSDYSGSQIDSAVSRANSTDVTAGIIAASKAVVVDSSKDISGFRHITATGNVTAANIILSGDVDLGDASGDTVTITGSIDSNLIPATDDTYDIGSATYAWQDLFLEGDINFSDGAEIDVASGNFTIDVAGDIEINADGGDITFKDASSTYATITSAGITTANTVSFGSLTDGTITITDFVDEDNMSSDSAVKVPTQQSVKAYVDATVTAQDLDFSGDSGGALNIDLDSESLTLTGGTGVVTVGSGNTMTFNSVDSEIVHDSLSGFVANEHIDHTSVTLTAGNGLSGGGTIAANRTFALDLNELSAKTSIVDADLIAIIDSADSNASKKITFENLEDAVFASVSGDVTITEGGVAQIADNAVDLTTHSTGNYVATITGGTGIDSSAATSGEGTTHNLSVDLNELTTETTIADADFIAMVDATDDASGKITFENLEDAIFASVSGDITITEGGVASIGSNAVVLGTDTTGNYVATVADSGGGGITVANSGSESAAVTLELDIKGLTEDSIASGDFIAFSDEGESGDPANRETIDDVATLFAGTGLTASSAVIGVDASQTQINAVGTLATGAISSGFGAIDIGSSTANFGATTVDSLSASDGNITNVGDIALDSISADGTDINIAVSDNSATALTVKQGSDAYLIIDTANSSESVAIGTGISGTAVSIGHGTSETIVNDNLTVTGDLTVSGTTTTVSSGTLTIGDTLIKLGQAYTGSAYDQGIVFTRGDGSSTNTQNMAFIWDESADTFAAIKAATETGTTSGNVTITDHVPLRVGALTADDASTFTSTISAATGSTIGNLTLANGSITDSSGAISFGDENLSTTGTFSAEHLTSTDDLTVSGLATIGETLGVTGIATFTAQSVHNGGLSTGALVMNDGSITDTSGAISFGDENLTTSGTLGAGVVTATGFTIGEAVITEAELEMIDGITAGTAAASKAVVLDGSKNIATLGTIGSGAITATGSSSFATSIKTPLIEYTDGTDAITIASNGGITAANGITSTAASNSFGATAFSGAVTTNSTIDGIDIATRDGVLTSTTTTANAALPKAGGTVTGATTFTDGVHFKGSAWNDIMIIGDTSRSNEEETHIRNGEVSFSINVNDGTYAAFAANHDGSAMTLGGDFGSGTLTVVPPTTFNGVPTVSASGGAVMKLHRDASEIQDGHDIGQIEFTGADPSSVHSGAMIRGEAAGNWTTDNENKPTELQFFTQDAGDGDGMASPNMIIDKDGSVLIGATASIGAALNISAASDSSQIQFFPEIDTDTNLIQMYDPSASLYIHADYRAASHTFKIGTTARMTVEAGGDVTVETGNLVIGTAGKGISFAATSDGTTMSSEILDDYEEGTFTPRIDYQNAGDNGDVTYVTQTGSYTKIGNRVHISFFLKWTLANTAAADNINIAGLPFTSNNVANLANPWICLVSGTSLGAGDTITASIAPNATSGALQNVGAGNAEANMGDDFGANANMTIEISGTYGV